MFQNWGNFADMSQGVAIYMTYASDVLLICWFGTQLTQHVRDSYIFYSGEVTCTIRSIKELGNLIRIQQSVIFPTICFSVVFWLSEIRNRFKYLYISWMLIKQTSISQFINIAILLFNLIRVLCFGQKQKSSF